MRNAGFYRLHARRVSPRGAPCNKTYSWPLRLNASTPLVISAFDDFGLEEVVIATQKGDSGGFQGIPIRRFAKPVRSETMHEQLELAPFNLQAGEFVRYHVQVRKPGYVGYFTEVEVRRGETTAVNVNLRPQP